MAPEKLHYIPEAEEYDIDPPRPELYLLRDLNARYGLDDKEPITNLHWEKTKDYLHDLTSDFNAAFPADATASDKSLAAMKVAHQLTAPIREAWEEFTPHYVDFGSRLLPAIEGNLTAALAANEPFKVQEIIAVAQRWSGEGTDPQTSADYRSGYCGSEMRNFASIEAAARLADLAYHGVSSTYESRTIDLAGYHAMTDAIIYDASDQRWALTTERFFIANEEIYGQESDQRRMALEEAGLYESFEIHFNGKMQPPGGAAFPLRLAEYPTREQRHELMISHQRDYLDPIRQITEALYETAPDQEYYAGLKLNRAATPAEAWQQTQEAWETIGNIKNPDLKEIATAIGRYHTDGWNISFAELSTAENDRWKIETGAAFKELSERILAADQWLTQQNHQPVNYTVEQITRIHLEQFRKEHPVLAQEGDRRRAEYARQIQDQNAAAEKFMNDD